jgi:hypothetical protein
MYQPAKVAAGRQTKVKTNCITLALQIKTPKLADVYNAATDAECDGASLYDAIVDAAVNRSLNNSSVHWTALFFSSVSAPHRRKRRRQRCRREEGRKSDRNSGLQADTRFDLHVLFAFRQPPTCQRPAAK